MNKFLPLIAVLFLIASSMTLAAQDEASISDNPNEGNPIAESQRSVGQCFEPTSFNRFRGTDVSVDFSDFLKSDDQRAIYWPGFTTVSYTHLRAHETP